MAGIVVTKTQWDALLQEDYMLDDLRSAVNVSTTFKDKLQRKGMTHGRRRIYPVKVGASMGAGARGELGTMPNYGAGEYVDAIVSAKYNYAPFKISGPALEFSDRKAWVEFGKKLLQDTKEALKISTGRQSWGDGSGTLALVNGAAALGATSITVDSAYGVAWGSLAANTTFLIKKNMYVQFGTEDNGGAGYQVTAVTGTTITISPALGAAVADNARIYVHGSKDIEIDGWLKLAGTSAFMTTTMGLANDTYSGIDRGDYPDWEGNAIDASAALGLTNIRTAKDTLFKRTEDEESNLCINSTEVTRDYEALLTQNQRFVPAVKLEGGYTALEHDGLRFTKDSKAPVKAFNLVNTKAIAWAQTRDVHWDDDGSGIMHRVSGQDAREGLAVWYSNLDCDEPRRQLIMFNLTVS